MRAEALPIMLAGLMGTIGIAEAALAAHANADPLLQTASQFLLIHALAVLALCALARTFARNRLLLTAAWVFILGSLIFCGDLTLRVFADHRAFPFAAPGGGSLLILGWILVASAGCLAALRRQPPD